LNPPTPVEPVVNLQQGLIKNYGVVLVLKLDPTISDLSKRLAIESFFAKREFDTVALGASADDKYPFCGFKKIQPKIKPEDPEPVFTGIFCGQFFTEDAGSFKHL